MVCRQPSGSGPADSLFRIQTQEALFEQTPSIERLVEFGPSKVLANIAKRTHARRFSNRDRTLLNRRHFLSSTQDIKELHYQYKPNDTDEHVDQSAASPTPAPESKSAEPSAPAIQVSPVKVKQVAASTIADLPTTPVEIVRAVVAAKVRKPLQDIKDALSIRDLCGGK